MLSSRLRPAVARSSPRTTLGCRGPARARALPVAGPAAAPGATRAAAQAVAAYSISSLSHHRYRHDHHYHHRSSQGLSQGHSCRPFDGHRLRPASAQPCHAGRPPPWHHQTRGKKTKTVKLDGRSRQQLSDSRQEEQQQQQQQQQQQRDEPPPPAEAEDASGPAYPTVVLQARRNMQKFDSCVLLTRVGGFYELYFEQAAEYGPLLNLKVAEKKTSAGPVPMAGFPFFQLDRYLKILVQDLSRYVAIAEEFPNSASERVRSGGLMHDRRVARIITPGTLIDENFMDPYANNYVMAVHIPGSSSSSPGRPTSRVGGEEEAGEQEENEPASAASVPAGQGHNDDKAHHNSVTSPPADPGTAASTPIGLAWLDISTGHFFTQDTTLASLGSILARVCPREVVLDEDLQHAGRHGGHQIFSILAEDRQLVTYAPRGGLRTLSDWAPVLESEIPAQAAGAFTGNEVRAGSLLLHYVKDRLQGLSMKLQPPLRHESAQTMTIDKNSMRALEIRQTIRDGSYRGSLLHAIRRTVTKSGARLLNEWLGSPSTSLDVIRGRQDLVACFIKNEQLRDLIVVLLKRSHDSQRLVQKFALGRGDPDDLLALASTIKATEDIVALLRGAQIAANQSESYTGCLAAMIDRISLESPRDLACRIRDAVDEEGLVQKHQIDDGEAGEMLELAQEVVSSEGSQEDSSIIPKSAAKRKKPASIKEYYGEDNEAWIMRPQASPGLGQLHTQLSSLLEEKTRLTGDLQQRLGASTLTLKWTPGLGHICHIRGKDTRSAAAADLRSVSSSRSTRSFHLPEWTSLGQRLDQARFQIRAEEQRVFHELRGQVVVNLVKLRRNAAVLDELDVATSFARLALEQGLSRPLLNHSAAHKIVGGRHPTVEGGLHEAGRSFTGNDCFVGAPGHGRVWLITGPNMAGKSTFLRQNALITILAQVGCYVPADYAELGVVDAIFSRVGSADNLYRDQSTFMVEMMETSEILRSATPRSFVIMDEIGRGTTPEDGTAVAFACLHHLVHVNRCRALFATHFHSLADLAEQQGMGMPEGLAGGAGAVEMYCTDVDEDGRGGFVYVHRLRKGINRQSHALKVARLAGLPEPAIRVAQGVLRGPMGHEKKQITNPGGAAKTKGIAG